MANSIKQPPASGKKKSRPLQTWWMNETIVAAILLSVAFLLYANSLKNGFVLDDEAVITKNNYVRQGIAGIPAIFSHDSFAGYERIGEQMTLVYGGRYRPLSLVFFAFFYQFFGPNEFVFHGFSILLYAFCGLILYRLLAYLLNKSQNGKIIAFGAALLFIAHPVHTEVVANIKGCDEQLAMLLGLAAVYSIFRYHDSARNKWAVLAGSLFLAACLAKENAVMLAITTPLAIWGFRKTAVIPALRTSWPLWFSLVLFLLLRGMAIGWHIEGQAMHDPLNNPFLEWSGQNWVACTQGAKAATILFTLGQYVRLMVFPHPLTHDYYPFQIELQDFGSPAVWLSLCLWLAMAGYGAWGLQRRQIAGFGILFFMLTLGITSNVVFPVGTFMAERFLFLPSAGFCLAVAACTVHFFTKNQPRLVLPVFLGLTVPLAIVTVLRNPAWADNETLFRTDIAHSPNSAKLHNSLGTALLEEAQQTQDPAEQRKLLDEAFAHLKAAKDLHKTYFDAYLAYGACAFYLQEFGQSVMAYRTAGQISPQDVKARTGLLYALRGQGDDLSKKGDAATAIPILTEAWEIQPDTATATRIAEDYFTLKQFDSSLEWLEKAAALAPDDPRLQKALAKVRQD
ncbi:MAG: glycosyltransferase family 39 protein [Bacteroidetes bacterium]|nr:glycosyltransferase family 39 protein [Bacteroidota bacterium]